MKTSSSHASRQHVADQIDRLVCVFMLAFSLIGMSVVVSGCKNISTCMDGSIFQLNEYTGLTIGYGNARTIAADTEYFEQTEQVTTSWFNSMAKDYRRVTIWASPFTNSPPEYLSESFKPNVNTDIVYSTVTTGDCVLNYIRAEQRVKSGD